MKGELEAVIAALAFPEWFDEEAREERRKVIRHNPGVLDFVIPVPDFYAWLRSASGVTEETAEAVIVGLEHYLHSQEIAYALLVYMYLDELAVVLDDRPDLRILLDRAKAYRGVIRVPRPSGRVH